MAVPGHTFSGCDHVLDPLLLGLGALVRSLAISLISALILSSRPLSPRERKASPSRTTQTWRLGFPRVRREDAELIVDAAIAHHLNGDRLRNLLEVLGRDAAAQAHHAVPAFAMDSP